MFKFKSLSSENIAECGASGVAPFGFVITQYDIVFHLQLVEYGLYKQHGGTVTFFGEVSGD